MVVKARLEESKLQMEHIRAGVFQIFPKNLILFLGWKDTELRATGDKAFDLEDLKKITQYRDCSSTTDSCVKFWEVMERFTVDQRCLYLKYVSGRARLPRGDLSQLSYQHQIEYYSRRERDSLPLAHTCFFRIDLPDYSSVDAMHHALLTAITYCGDMDADRGANEIGGED